MAIIYTYPAKSRVVNADKIIISDSQEKDNTKAVTIEVLFQDLLKLINENTNRIEALDAELTERIAVITQDVERTDSSLKVLENDNEENKEAIKDIGDDLERVKEKNNLLGQEVEDNTDAIEANEGSIKELKGEIAELKDRLDICCPEASIRSVTPSQMQAPYQNSYTVVIEGTSTVWTSFDDVNTSFGSNMTIVSTTVDSDTQITAVIKPDAGAPPVQGTYDVEVKGVNGGIVVQTLVKVGGWIILGLK